MSKVKVLIDCMLPEVEDQTHIFLVDLAKSLELLDCEVVLHPDFQSELLHSVGLKNATNTIRSNPRPSGNTPAEYILRLRKTRSAWGLSEVDAESGIASQTQMLTDNKIDKVVLWSNEHPRPLETFIAAKNLGLEVFVIERGLIPNTWVIARDKVWSETLDTGIVLPDHVVDQVKEMALRKIANPALERYTEFVPFSQNPDADEKHYDAVFFTGFAQPLGMNLDDYELTVRNFANEIKESAGLIELGIRYHPACKLNLDRNTAEELEKMSLYKALNSGETNVVLGSNVWVQSVLLEKPTLLISWQGIDSNYTSSEASLRNIRNRNDLKIFAKQESRRLTTLLSEQLARTHFFNLDGLPSAKDMARIVVPAAGIDSKPNFLSDVTGSEAALALLRELRAKSLSRDVQLDCAIHQRAAALSERDQALAERDAEVEKRLAATLERDQALAERDAKVIEIENFLNSKTWRWTKFIRNIYRV